jgi:hypothetical protein
MSRPRGEERRPRRSLRARLAIRVAGWGFLVLGVLGLVLPILQGFLFLLVGLYILSFEVAWAKRVRAWLVARFPQAGAKVEEAEARADAWFEKHRKNWNKGVDGLKRRLGANGGDRRNGGRK